MSSSKLFLFNKEELSQISDKKTKAIGLSGKTWEEAMRFMISKVFASLDTKLDTQKNLIGYQITWTEQEELQARMRSGSIEMIDEFEAFRENKAFIDEFILMARQEILNSVE